MTGRATPKVRAPKVCLVMIVRDEAEILPERLRAVRDEIDGWLIVDTGSVDGTQQVVLQELAGIPGRLVDRPWAGFADARTAAVEWASREHQFWGGGEWWALLLDADTVFHALPKWKRILQGPSDVISCEVHHGTIRYSHPRLLKLGELTWRWRGVLHEYLEIPVGARPASTHTVWVEHGSGGARSKNPQKYLLDAELLRATRKNLLPDSDDMALLPRYTFYEAQSWRDGGRPAAAEEAYLERASMGGFGQEVYLAWLNVGELRLADGEAVGAFEAWTRAWGVDPSRAEALIGLATVCRGWESWWPAWTFARLAESAAVRSAGMFADLNVRWRAAFETSVAAWYVGKLREGREACVEVLEAELAPEDVKVRTRSNLALYEGVR